MEHTETIKLVLTRNSLHINDDMIAQVKKGRVVGLDPQDLKNSDLYQRLAIKFKQSEETADESEPKNHILLLCDRRHRFITINDIIKTAALAGYPNFQFAVLTE